MNNDVIRLLPDSVANQIAAGEVIQRPASVVKELVENAVDAGATNIKLVIKDAGRSLIQVIDNGCGMSDTDARLAFERHSTSKIKSAADLFSLNTMGFRGEALASIVAVSQVELKTKRNGDALGTKICISGSKVESQEPEACSTGTSMMVKNLFFNVPARRKFLKKDAIELSNIVHEFERLALVNPDIELTIIHNDSILHQLTAGNLKQRIGQLFGKGVERQMLPVETATSLVKITGFVGLPEGARKRNWLQYFFVNGRNMKHPYFHKAVMNCYEKLIAPDVQPNYFINFEVDPSTIDVNIHPTKNEIKFENEQAIWQILEATIRESLGKFNVAPAIDFNTDEIPEIPAFAPTVSSRPDIGDEGPVYNPFDLGGTFTPSTPADFTDTPVSTHARPSALNQRSENRPSFNDWDQLYSKWTGNDSPESKSQLEFTSAGSSINGPSSESLFDQTQESEAESSSVMQFKSKYILSAARSGLLVIDQHRAHVRILYEEYLKSLQSSSQASQSLLYPDIIELTPAQDSILGEIRPRLQEVGFDIERMNMGQWAINGMPAMVAEQNPAEMLKSLIDRITQGNVDIKGEIDSAIALTMARSSAIKAGQVLTRETMEHLLSNLFALSTPTYTPDGLLVLRIIDTDTLTRAF